MTDKEFQEWKLHPVSEEFFAHIKKAKLEAQEAWANRQFTTEADNQFALGGVYAINQILELDYEDIMGV
jgi:hypothetical protein